MGGEAKRMIYKKKDIYGKKRWIEALKLTLIALGGPLFILSILILKIIFIGGWAKRMKCLVCGRTKQGAMVCHPCRLAADRLIRNGFSALETFIIMRYPKIMNRRKLLKES